MNDITHDRIVEIVGDIEDIRVAEIIATGASEDEIEEAAHWASGMSQPARPWSTTWSASRPGSTTSSPRIGRSRKPANKRSFVRVAAASGSLYE